MPDLELAGAILVGGRSSRLGFPKARLRLGSGRELVDDLIVKLRRVAADVVLVGGDERVYGNRDARWVPDAFPDAGPLGGIATALTASGADWTFVLACDLPFLRTAILRRLADARSDVDAVVPVVDGRPEPTQALYSRACLPAIQPRLAAGQLKIAGFFPDIRVRLLDEADLRLTDPQLESFTNTNTPAELVAAVDRVARFGTNLLLT